MLTVLYVLLGIVALLFVVALFSKKSYAIVKEITIDRPADTVFNYVRHLKNQDQYNKYVMVDPAMKKDFTGTDGTPGFVYAWDGNKHAGKGEQTIKTIKDGERVDYQIHFIRPFEGLADAHFVTQPVGPNQTKVQWGFGSTMKYPMNIMLLFMNMDNTIGKTTAESLANLKAVLETK